MSVAVKVTKVSLIVAAVICVWHYLLYPGIMSILPPGTNWWKYNIDIPEIMNSKVSREDSIRFRDKILPRIYDRLFELALGNDYPPKGIYNLNRPAKKIADGKDTIKKYCMMHRSENISGDKECYFVAVLEEEYAIPNDSVKRSYYDDFTLWVFAVAVNKKTDSINLIERGNIGYVEETADQIDLKKDAEYRMKEIIVDFHYYLDLPLVKIHNPWFWDRIFVDEEKEEEKQDKEQLKSEIKDLLKH